MKVEDPETFKEGAVPMQEQEPKDCVLCGLSPEVHEVETCQICYTEVLSSNMESDFCGESCRFCVNCIRSHIIRQFDCKVKDFNCLCRVTSLLKEEKIEAFLGPEDYGKLLVFRLARKID
jgi:hypothetical protein